MQISRAIYEWSEISVFVLCAQSTMYACIYQISHFHSLTFQFLGADEFEVRLSELSLLQSKSEHLQTCHFVLQNHTCKLTTGRLAYTKRMVLKFEFTSRPSKTLYCRTINCRKMWISDFRMRCRSVYIKNSRTPFTKRPFPEDKRNLFSLRFFTQRQVCVLLL